MYIPRVIQKSNFAKEAAQIFVSGVSGIAEGKTRMKTKICYQADAGRNDFSITSGIK